MRYKSQVSFSHQQVWSVPAGQRPFPGPGWVLGEIDVERAS